MRRRSCLILVILVSIVTIYIVGIWEPVDESKTVNSGSVISSSEIKADVESYEVDRDQLLSKLSRIEKEELNNILKSISVVDIAKIEGYIINKNDDKDFKDALELLEKRLSKEEYKKVEEILSPYIDLDILNKNK